MATAVDSVPEELIVDFDVFDPAVVADDDTFQRRAAELAARGPVLYSKAHGGHWIFTRYDDAEEPRVPVQRASLESLDPLIDPLPLVLAGEAAIAAAAVDDGNGEGEPLAAIGARPYVNR